MKSGLIFDIKRYAIHDGPGIRTTIFLKGCPLACPWCHNPEGMATSPQILYRANRCIGCCECVAACPNHATSMTPDGVRTDPKRCEKCGECVDVCLPGAREMTGHVHTVDDIIQILSRDILFFDESGGGVTFSGGEPLYQHRFLMALLEACGRHDIHRAVDTSGYVEEDLLKKTAEETDLFLFDLKMMDPERHRRYTGVSNDIILRNLKLLSRLGRDVIIRIPLLPGVNDDPANIDETGAFLAGIPGVNQVHLLPYHYSAKDKYRQMALPFRPAVTQPFAPIKTHALAKRLTTYGLHVEIGG